MKKDFALILIGEEERQQKRWNRKEKKKQKERIEIRLNVAYFSYVYNCSDHLLNMFICRVRARERSIANRSYH